MPLAKLFRVTDTDGQRWHIAAPSFSRAVEALSDWENEPHTSDDEVVQAVEVVEDLIIGGNREESMDGGHIQIDLSPKRFPSTDWTMANNMAHAANDLLSLIRPAPHDIMTPMDEYLKKIRALRDAVDVYEQIPF